MATAADACGPRIQKACEYGYTIFVMLLAVAMLGAEYVVARLLGRLLADRSKQIGCAVSRRP
jgi:hypothetical protein